MRWLVVASLVATALAGCAEEDSPAMVLGVQEAAQQEAMHTFHVEGRSRVDEEAREVVIRVYYEGRMQTFLEYTAEPEADPEHLQTYRIAPGTASIDVVADGETYFGAAFDPSDCASGEGDFRVVVGEPTFRYHGSGIEIHYGCL